MTRTDGIQGAQGEGNREKGRKSAAQPNHAAMQVASAAAIPA
nr:hypothetical protein [Akkermansia muciniphila]